MAEILIVMKFVKAFFDYFFGLGAVLVLMDLFVFDGGIEAMLNLPGPLKIVAAIGIGTYWSARTIWFIISKRLEYRERMIEILKKEKELFQ